MNVLDIKTIFAAGIIGFAFLPGAALSEPRHYVARAQSLETGELLYTEHHREIWSGDQLVGGIVEYRSPDGEVFASKELSFERSATAPAFHMIDRRDGFEEGADWTESGLRLFASRGEDLKSSTIETLPESVVIDAGFHRFMQAHLSRLVMGEEAEFSFAVPSYGRFFRFRVSMVGEPRSEQVRLKMKPVNAFLRLLANPIELVYDRSGRLLEFEGMTNIPDEDGERHLARIVFTYPDGPEDVAQIASAS